MHFFIKSNCTVPQLTKYERILSILAWLILFWFLAAVLQTASKNAIFCTFFGQKKPNTNTWKLLLLLTRFIFRGITFDSVELQKWSCTLKNPQTICQKLVMYLYGARMAHCSVWDYFLISGHQNFYRICYSSNVNLRQLKGLNL